MTDKELLKSLQPSDLPENYSELAKIIGFNGFKWLVYRYGGSTLYVPQMSEVVRLYKYRLIRADFDGSNMTELAKRYGVSDRTLYRLLSDKLSAARRAPLPGQINLNEYFSHLSAAPDG